MGKTANECDLGYPKEPFEYENRQKVVAKPSESKRRKWKEGPLGDSISLRPCTKMEIRAPMFDRSPPGAGEGRRESLPFGSLTLAVQGD
jgi:hypothetical protein